MELVRWWRECTKFLFNLEKQNATHAYIQIKKPMKNSVFEEIQSTNPSKKHLCLNRLFFIISTYSNKISVLLDTKNVL